jgi:hypothetical protein
MQQAAGTMQEQQLKQAAGLVLHGGYEHTYETYLQDREFLGAIVIDNVHGSFRLGLLASLLVKQPERECCGYFFCILLLFFIL